MKPIWLSREVRKAAHDYITTAFEVDDSLHLIACTKRVDLGERTLLYANVCKSKMAKNIEIAIKKTNKTNWGLSLENFVGSASALG